MRKLALRSNWNLKAKFNSQGESSLRVWTWAGWLELTQRAKLLSQLELLKSSNDNDQWRSSRSRDNFSGLVIKGSKRAYLAALFFIKW